MTFEVWAVWDQVLELHVSGYCYRSLAGRDIVLSILSVVCIVSTGLYIVKLFPPPVRTITLIVFPHYI